MNEVEALGLTVEAVYATGDGAHDRGKVIGYYAEPTVVIEREDGSQFTWPVRLIRMGTPREGGHLPTDEADRRATKCAACGGRRDDHAGWLPSSFVPPAISDHPFSEPGSAPMDEASSCGWLFGLTVACELPKGHEGGHRAL